MLRRDWVQVLPPSQEGSWGSQQREHHVLHPSPWSSGGHSSELLCHFFHVQKACETIPMLCSSFWQGLCSAEGAGPWVAIPPLLGEKSCASFGMTHMEGDDVPPGYGACSSWEKCGALPSHGHLTQTGERGLGRAHVLRVEGKPSLRSPSPPPASPCLAEQ